MADSRFAHIATDKRFKPIRRVDRTVKVGKRFEKMFTDDDFTSEPTGGADLKRFYHTEADEEADEAKVVGSAAPSEPSAGDFLIDYSRGEVLMESSEEEEDDDDAADDELGGQGEAIDVWGGGHVEMHEEVPSTEVVGKRLAICNLDWSAVKAADLFVLANSFKPAAGAIETVTIYPSDFGLERMKEEAMSGPGRLIRDASDGAPATTTDTTADSGEPGLQIERLDDDGSQEHLRLYEMQKLRYYYAVVECDSSDTANTIYEAIDGLEFEKTQNVLDVRCVPDDVTFDNEVHDRCTELPAEIDFKLDQIPQAALAHSKVKLTWDEDDKNERIVLKKRKFSKSELDQIDYSNYLASESDSDTGNESNDEQKRRLFRNLVAECQQEEDDAQPDEEMEVTWAIGLKEKAAEQLKARAERLEEKNMTVGELLAKKRREKKRLRKQRIKDLNSRAKDIDSDADEDQSMRIGGDDPYFQLNLAEEFPEGVQEPPETSAQAAHQHTSKQVASASTSNGHSDNREGITVENNYTDEDEDESRHFDMTKIIKAHKVATKKSKSRRKATGAEQPAVQDNFTLNIADKRFAAVFSDKDYSIDPTRPEFKKTREMDRLISERQTRLAKGGLHALNTPKTTERDNISGDNGAQVDLKTLVAKVKRKSKKKTI